MITIDKLPKNIEAEKAALGAMLTSATAKDEGLSTLQEESFYSKIHQKIFIAIYNVSLKNKPVDIQTVTQELQNLKCLDEVGGVDYLYELTQSLILAENMNEYVKIVKENANLRNLLKTIGDIEQDYLSKTKQEGYSAFVADAQRKIDKIADEREISNFSTSKEIVGKLEHQIFELAEKRKEGDLTGVNTGFKLLNYYTNGLQKENLIIVAGRTGCGKTAFALNLALNAATSKKPVAIFEMEMSSSLLYSRLLSNLSKIENRKILTGKIYGRERVAIKESLDKLADLKIFVDESSSLTILDLQAKARKLKAEQPDLALIIIDYIGLIASDGKRKRYDSRQLEIQEYTRALHELARELKVPIVLLCQLNRKVDDRGEGGTPRLSDLRESGSIEQDAEIVLLLHRPDYGKNEITEENEKKKQQQKITAANMTPEARSALMDKVTENAVNEQSGKNTNIMNVIIAKNRNGESDRVVKLLFEKDISKFSDLPEDFYKSEHEIQNKYTQED